MRIRLNISDERDLQKIKEKGARFDASHNIWYIESDQDRNNFIEWLETDKYSLILLSPIYLMEVETYCYHCKEKLKAQTFYAKSFYETCYPQDCICDTVYDVQEGEEDKPHFFLHKFNPTLFNHVYTIDHERSTFLEAYYPNLYFKENLDNVTGHVDSEKNKTLVTHCIHCGEAISEYFLHGPGGYAFFITEPRNYHKVVFHLLDFEYAIKIDATLTYQSNIEDIFRSAYKQDFFQYH